jgi:hypothetical protein
MNITNNIQDKNFLFLKKYCELLPQEANKFVVLKETANGTINKMLSEMGSDKTL